MEGNTVNISDLGVEQLTGMNKQIEQELVFFQESVMSLKGILVKNNQAIVSLQSLKGVEGGRQALIPLSESMYVRAELSDPSRQLVEVGTGYFAEMSREKAMDFFERKKKYITTQVETIENIMTERKRTRAVLSEKLQERIASQIASMPPPQSK